MTSTTRFAAPPPPEPPVAGPACGTRGCAPATACAAGRGWVLVLVAALLGPALALSPAAAAGVEPEGVWPLDPTPDVVAGFDPPAVRWQAGHRGVDLAGRLGQPVRAALAGRVAFAGRLAGRGVVVVQHGSTRTTYEPVSATVAAGDLVRTGEQVGRLQLFGSHCFPRVCLHWGLIEGRDHYRDPLTLVGSAPVVLLPLLGGHAAATGAAARAARPATAGLTGHAPVPPVAVAARTATPSWLRWPQSGRVAVTGPARLSVDNTRPVPPPTAWAGDTDWSARRRRAARRGR